MNKKFYQTDEFKRLASEWEEKLKDEGLGLIGYGQVVTKQKFKGGPTGSHLTKVSGGKWAAKPLHYSAMWEMDLLDNLDSPETIKENEEILNTFDFEAEFREKVRGRDPMEKPKLIKNVFRLYAEKKPLREIADLFKRPNGKKYSPEGIRQLIMKVKERHKEPDCKRVA